jgi:Cys-rich repeat protein
VTKGKCVECLSNAECPAAEPVCDPDDFECRAAPACTTNAQCAAPTPICADGQCVQCKEDRDCPATAPRCKDETCTVPK